MRKWVIFFILVLLAILAYNYIYKDHRDIEAEETVIKVSATSLKNDFTNNPIKSDEQYIDKTIEVYGLITEINSNNITLNNKVFCLFNGGVYNLTEEDIELNIKGRVIGYDDLLEQVKLDQCVIVATISNN